MKLGPDVPNDLARFATSTCSPGSDEKVTPSYWPATTALLARSSKSIFTRPASARPATRTIEAHHATSAQIRPHPWDVIDRSPWIIAMGLTGSTLSCPVAIVNFGFPKPS